MWCWALLFRLLSLGSPQALWGSCSILGVLPGPSRISGSLSSCSRSLLPKGHIPGQTIPDTSSRWVSLSLSGVTSVPSPLLLPRAWLGRTAASSRARCCSAGFSLHSNTRAWSFLAPLGFRAPALPGFCWVRWHPPVSSLWLPWALWGLLGLFEAPLDVCPGSSELFWPLSPVPFSDASRGLWHLQAS